ncbi:hypothetical protein TNCT_626641 [Trichonephila clavata]|uniref:Uncharacterized protein n=1 Tax=Trichonephila clavata TaxID=2740835 RepID=A0A8X6I0D5_TRICU|nr:hypothetical protein TNCT_626641 [Trichonephila clavata]
MANKMALVPHELHSEYYQLSKPEIRLKDNISNMLNEKETTDGKTIRFDSKISKKYFRTTTLFEIPSELLAESKVPDEKLLEISSKLSRRMT